MSLSGNEKSEKGRDKSQRFLDSGLLEVLQDGFFSKMKKQRELLAGVHLCQRYSRLIKKSQIEKEYRTRKTGDNVNKASLRKNAEYRRQKTGENVNKASLFVLRAACFVREFVEQSQFVACVLNLWQYFFSAGFVTSLMATGCAAESLEHIY